MPYAVPDGGILQLVFTGKVLNQQMLTIFHYRLDKAGGITDGAAVAAQVCEEVNAAGALHQKFMECISRDYKTARIRAQWILPDRFAYHEKLPAQLIGMVDATVVAPNVSVVINKRGEGAGAHHRGTTHMPGVPLDFVDTGRVAAIGFTAYNDFVVKFLEGVETLATDLMKPVIYNRTTPGDSVDIVNCVVSEDYRTMHRRTVGLGA